MNFHPEKPYNLVCASVHFFEEEEVQNRFIKPPEIEGIDKATLNRLIAFGIMSGKAFLADTPFTDENYIISRCITNKILDKLSTTSGFFFSTENNGIIMEYTKTVSKNDVSAFIVFCECITAFNIFHRKLNAKGEIVVEEADINKAKEIFESGEDSKLGSVERQIIAIFEMPPIIEGDKVKTMDELTVYEIHSYYKIYYTNKTMSLMNIRRGVDALCNKGRLEIIKKEGDKRYYYKLA